MFKYLKSRFTMKRIEPIFWDRVAQKLVFLWIDDYGQEWMAINKFGMRAKYKELEKTLSSN